MPSTTTRSTYLVVGETGLLNLVGNGEGVGESGDVSTDLVEGEREVGSDSSNELLLGLLSETDDGDLLADTFSVLNVPSSRLGDGGVDSTTESSVGGDDDVEDLLDLGLGLAGLGLGEDGVVGDSVRFRLHHRLLRSSESGSCSWECSTSGAVLRDGGSDRTDQQPSSSIS